MLLKRFEQKKYGDMTNGRLSPGVAKPYYNSEEEAAAAWSDVYRSLGVRKEYAAFVYSATIGGVRKYYIGRTYEGMGKHGMIRANVVIAFLYLYLIQTTKERLKRKAKISAFLHTHPKPPAGFTCRYHSAEDMFLLKLPRIVAVYVIPYENKEINRAQKGG